LRIAAKQPRSLAETERRDLLLGFLRRRCLAPRLAYLREPDFLVLEPFVIDIVGVLLLDNLFEVLALLEGVLLRGERRRALVSLVLLERLVQHARLT